jgi:hypothetical protein
MPSTKKNAPGADDAQGQNNIGVSRSVSKNDTIVAYQRCSVAQLSPTAI